MVGPIVTDATERPDPGLRPVRLVLLFGIATGLAMTMYFLVVADETPLAWDFLAYYRGAEAAIAGDAFVGLEPEQGGGEYVYPPVVVLAFVPYALLGSWELAFGFHALINVAALTLLGLVTLRELDRIGIDQTPTDRWLVMLFAVASLYPVMNVGLGQVDPFVAVLLAGAFLAVDRVDAAAGGVALGLAAVVKLFPAAFGLWFVVRRRLRAIAAAAITGIAGIVASLLVFGWDTNHAYLELILFERSRLDDFAEGVSPDFFSVTLVRPIAAVVPGSVPSIAYLLIAVALVVPLLWIVYSHTETRLDRHAAFLATLVAVLIALPSSNLNHLLYLYMPAVVLMYGLTPGQPRRLLLIGLAILLFPLQPAIVGGTLEALSIPPVVADPLHAAAKSLLSVVSVALIGAVVVLVACVRHAQCRPGSDERVDQLG